MTAGKLNNDILIKGLRERDVRTIRHIYKEFFPSIKAHIISNSGGEEEANDIFHDALIVLYRNTEKVDFQLTSSLHTYLFAIAKNLWLKKLNRRKRKNGVTIEQLEGSTINTETEQQIEKTERYQLYRDKFKELANDCQKILSMFFERKSMAEISKAMDHGSEGYTRKRKFNCQQKLMTIIKADPRFDDLK